MGPAVCLGPGAISIKVEWVQGAPPHLLTETSYAGTRDNTWQRAYMPATIFIARGLLSPMPVFWAAFLLLWGNGVNGNLLADFSCLAPGGKV